MFFLKAVNEAELTVSLLDKALLIARYSSSNDSLHGAEKKAMLLGQRELCLQIVKTTQTPVYAKVAIPNHTTWSIGYTAGNG